MITPDLAALRALVARAGTTTIYCSCYSCRAIRPLVLAAQAALALVERDLADQQTDNVIVWRGSGSDLATDVISILQDPTKARPQEMPRFLDKWDKLCAARASLPQVTRDVAYWRKRAENAEALVQWQDTTRQRGPIIQGDAATTTERRDE